MNTKTKTKEQNTPTESQKTTPKRRGSVNKPTPTDNVGIISLIAKRQYDKLFNGKVEEVVFCPELEIELVAKINALTPVFRNIYDEIQNTLKRLNDIRHEYAKITKTTVKNPKK